MTIRSAAAIASSTPGAGRASSIPTNSIRSIVSAAPCLTRYSWKVRVPAGVVMRLRTGSSVIGRSVAATPRRAQISAVTSLRRRPLAEADGAVDVGRQVAVAEAEPRVLAVGGQALEAAEGVVGIAPAALGDDPGEDVGADVEVRADPQPVEVAVVAGVDHGRELGLAGDLGQAVHHLGAAGSARQSQDHGRRSGAGMLTAAWASLPTAPVRRPAGRAPATAPPPRPPSRPSRSGSRGPGRPRSAGR